jgi:hypothetical protein
VTRRISTILLLSGALGAAGCAAVRSGRIGPAPVRQIDQGLPAPADLPEDSPERAALAAAQAQEAKGDASGAAHDAARGAWAAAAAEYASVAERGAGAEWRLPLRQRAAELYLRAQRWEKAAEVAQAIVADPKAGDPSRAVGARLAATAWLGAANSAAKAGQVE